MAVARAAPLRQKLCSVSFAPIRAATSTATRAWYSSAATRGSRRFIPDYARVYYRNDGALITTQANLDFLRDFNISHDNGEIPSTPWNAANRTLFGALGVSVNFSPKHVISPYHLSFLDPRGHPLAAKFRERYAQMARNQPLWVITTCKGGPKAVVRHTATRKVRAAVYLALEAKRYTMHGKGEHGDIEGTLWMHISDSLKTVAYRQKEEFGEHVVSLMEIMLKRSLLQEKLKPEDVKLVKKRRRGNLSMSQLNEATKDPDFRASDVPLRRPKARKRAANDSARNSPWLGRGKQRTEEEWRNRRSGGEEERPNRDSSSMGQLNEATQDPDLRTSDVPLRRPTARKRAANDSARNSPSLDRGKQRTEEERRNRRSGGEEEWPTRN